MKKLLLTVLFFFIYSITFGQNDNGNNSNYQILRSTLAYSGSSKRIQTGNGAYLISQSVGQSSIISTVKENNYTILQGFQQPNTILQIPSLSEAINVLIGPNPVNVSLKIVFKETISDYVNVHIIDINGRTVKQEKFLPSQILNLSLNRLNGGIYVLHINTKTKQYITKLIKQ